MTFFHNILRVVVSNCSALGETFRGGCDSIEDATQLHQVRLTDPWLSYL